MYHQDYLIKQIRDMVKFIAKVLLKKEKPEYILSIDEEHAKYDLLHKRLLSMIGEGNINEAEDLLFEKLDYSNPRYIELALDFYSRLNDLDDSFLAENNFSREEIEEGLKEIAKELGIFI